MDSLRVGICDTQQLLELAAKRLAAEGPQLTATVPYYWRTFLRWVQAQIEYDRRVLVEGLAVISLARAEDEKVLKLTLLDSFVVQHGLHHRVISTAIQEHLQEGTQPTITVSFSGVAKMMERTEDRDKAKAAVVLTTVFRTIAGLLSQQQKGSFELDLGPLGKLLMFGGTVTHEPYAVMRRTLGDSSKTIVSQLLSEKENTMKLRKTDSLPQLKPAMVSPTNTVDEFRTSTKTGFFRSTTKNFNPVLRTTAPFETPTRRFNRMEVQLNSDMLGAGTDPLARTVDFSVLAHDAESLINTSFQRPDNTQMRFPAVIDKFARTIASPITSQKYNMSICGRIGSNYNIRARKLYFDSQGKCIKEMYCRESASRFTAAPQLLMQTATDEEELLYFCTESEDVRSELQVKMNAKRACFERYRAYIIREITPDCVAPIRDTWIRSILDSITANFAGLNRQIAEKLIDEMLSVINHQYYYSSRKAILDYVLKDSEERNRIGIVTVMQPVEEWGCSTRKTIRLSAESVQLTAQARLEMSDGLLLLPQCLLKIADEWRKYQNVLFFNLAKRRSQPVNLLYFIKKQQEKIAEVRNSLRSQWLKNLANYIREDLQAIAQDKRKVAMFFRAVNTVMANQLRELVNDSLQCYLDFFRHFKKERYYTHQEVLERERDPTLPTENVFLTIKLKDEGSDIVFSEDLQLKVKVELLDLLRQVLAETEQFPRIDNHFRNEKHFLWAVPQQDAYYLRCLAETEAILRDNFRCVADSRSVYNRYAYLLTRQQEVLEWCRTRRQIKDYRQKLQQYSELYEAVLKQLPYFIRMNMVLVDCTDIKRKLLETITAIRLTLHQSMYEQVKKLNSDVFRRIETIKETLKPKAESTAKLLELQAEIDRVKKTELASIKAEFAELRLWMGTLYDTGSAQLLEENFVSICLTATCVYTLADRVDHEEVRINREKEELEKVVRQQATDFKTEVDRLDRQLEILIEECSLRKQYTYYNKTIKAYAEKTEQCQRQMQHINTQEQNLGWPHTAFPELEKIEINLKPNEELWTLVAQVETSVKEWKTQFTKNLNPEEIEQSLRKTLGQLTRIIGEFGKRHATPLKIANEIRAELLELQQKYLPLIRIFANRGLKERHWDAFSKQFQICENKETLNLHKIINYKMVEEPHKIALLEEIAEAATQEFAIERMKNRMSEQWFGVVLEVKQHKDTGTHIISGASVEEIQALLDDHLIKTASIKSSQHARIFQQSLTEWQGWLKYCFQLFECWTKVQGMWLYLEPVFSSADIIKHLPVEQSEFESVDNSWKSIMKRVCEQPKVLDFTKNRKMLDIFQEGVAKLEIVQRGLNSYLEGKRLSFPRFFFLSNEELLEILSETKDPQRVQPHLKKCFEGIQRLKIDDDKKIRGMLSSEGEYVAFLTVVDTTAAKGNVDEWLLNVESSMLEAVRKAVDTAHADYKIKKRCEWALNRCGMAVLNQDMTYWTSDAEEAINQQILDRFAERCEQGLQEIVGVVRQPISPLDRCTLEALIVLNVHNRDVVNSLTSANINDLHDFEWQSQLRYYYTPEKMGTYVRIINAHCDYNYEYLGNSARLVITPLTDRCYRTLCGALHLNYGGAPEGPAGTGKTETVKDLAKALARQCVVFNCSDGLDYKAMGKFFKGIASTGAWSCFDEFNRINLEVLSVVAQQILTIQLARGRGLSHFSFEEIQINLKPTANCFITMNPGYAGRSELPDNLKALFRSVAMMVPDYAMIAEISLYSFGFGDARNLAGKIVTTYKLCSQQLSSQDHYDYGMRAVKSVLTAAGNLKRRYPNQQENVLMLRAITDINLPKFLEFDIPLFRGITSDLFPGVSLPENDYSLLMKCVAEELERLKFKSVPYLLEKIVQLYEMVLVRHGLMVVGRPFSGKTTCIELLSAALGLMKKHGDTEKHVELVTLNPKSLTMNQLYGCFDDVSHEWFDGVLAVKFRNLAKSEEDCRKWLVFDGPIDAVWIENMNTVLDDNKKLCLNSGEIIAMGRDMNLLFEPMDLLAASPATVSRCGMIYMEPTAMGWQHLFEAWKCTLPKTMTSDDTQEIDWLFQTFVPPVLQFVRTQTKEICETELQNLIVSLMRTYISMLEDYANSEKYANLDRKQLVNALSSKFVFALVWSLGGSLTTDYRKPFDSYLKRVLNGDIGGDKKKKLYFPDRGLLYDYCVSTKDTGEVEWVRWLDTIANVDDIPAKSLPHQIIVKTNDTLRYSHLLKMSILAGKPILFCGPTGTGKTVYIKNVLLNELDKSVYNTLIEVGFSAQTSSTQTQEIIDSRLDRRGKNMYGPKLGKAVLFVDDLNMPAKEKYGAQPPIELLRQMLDQGGWYDNKDKEKPLRRIIDVMFVAAMGQPGGGRSALTPRFMRHLHLISLTQFEDETLTRIFSSILRWYLTSNNFHQEVVKTESKAVAATLEVYKESIKRLLPTTKKSHYLFNLRDFSKVILGMCFADKERITTAEGFARLWAHQVWRVFSDRLTNDGDRTVIFSAIRDNIKRNFNLNFDTVFGFLDLPDKSGKMDGRVDTLDEFRRLIFTDVVGDGKRTYDEVRDWQKLQVAVEGSLKSYNEVNGGKHMNLVMFEFAIEHLLTINRVLKQPGGNALLIGVGGSGRQSLTRLASFLANLTLFQIEISKQYGRNEWMEDLKLVLKGAGRDQPSIFLFTDSQIKSESFVEDINSLLNTGEVPNLFNSDEKAEVLELVKQDPRALKGDCTPAQLYSYFLERVRRNLHIVLCFSPIGDAFRQRVRMFPSLVNCCTIDWFQEWPKDALVSVARTFMRSLDMEPAVRDACVEMVEYFHASTISWAQKFEEQLKRKYYVTPTSFIELIRTFQTLLTDKRKVVKDLIAKYENGFEKIVSTEAAVGKMQENLIKLQPELKRAAQQTEIKMKEVAEKKAEADVLKEAISGEEKIVTEAVNAANSIKEDCNRELEMALPDLRAAEDAVKCINKSEIDTVKKFTNPTAVIKLVLKGLVLILDPAPKETMKDEKTLKNVTNWWAASVRILGDNLVKKLEDFKIDTVDEKTITGLGKFLNDPDNAKDLEPESVANASMLMVAILNWIKGTYKYYFVNKRVKPMKEALAKAEKEAAELQGKLSVKRAELKKAVDTVDELNSDYQSTCANKNRLEAEYADCKKKLVIAKQLISNLGGEKGRWEDLAKSLSSFYVNLSGDVLIGAGMIAYLGAFTSAYRNEISAEWVKRCLQHKIPSSESFSLQRVLGNPVKIRSWNINGLPSDNFSVENAIIIEHARRWSLCIDPQNQANKWIKRSYAGSNLSIVKLSDSDYLRTIEISIQFGSVVLLENVGEELDPSLQPILLKQTYGRGQTQYIKLSQEIEYNRNFKLYITTKRRNPHYLPEVSTKLTLLNFMITFEGLNDQLLGILVKTERPQLEAEKEKLIVDGANNKKELQEIEDKILDILSNSQNILADESAIDVLTEAKLKSNLIGERQTAADLTERTIDEARFSYQSVSKEAACLFFVVSDLGNIDPMYQYSLTYYIDLFTQAISNSQSNDKLEQRLENLRAYYRRSLYNNICRSLFEKDKLLFSFLLTCRLAQFRGELDQERWRFLLTGGLSLGEKLRPVPESAGWITPKIWGQLNRLSVIGKFVKLNELICNDTFLKKLQAIFQDANPHLCKLPKEVEEFFEPIDRLVLLRTLRPDKLVPAVQSFVEEQLGEQFIDPPAFDLSKIFPDSSCSAPLIFVLSPGSDPFSSLNIFADQTHKTISSISLGQGQGPLAERHIQQGKERGSWIVLQNCHLAVSWMPTLERIVEDIANNSHSLHPDFRLWLTSYPSNDFPASVLQSGIKMTNQQPKGLRNNLIASFLTDPINNNEFFNSCVNPAAFTKLLYGLCFFHAVIQQRRNYGSLGWNIPYEFNESDLRICVRQLKMFIDESPDTMPFKALKYLTAECNYGGRVTDDKDRRLIVTLLEDYYCEEALSNPDYCYSGLHEYAPPQEETHEGIMKFIHKHIPLETPPEVFGFHTNANITKDMKETGLLLESLLVCSQEAASAASSSTDELLKSIISEILKDFPQEFNVEKALEKYPVTYTDSMNTVLTQELTRFNRLITVIRASLRDITLSLDGLILMSTPLEKAARSLMDGKIPQLWMAQSYPSLKPAGSYVADLKCRLRFLAGWIENGHPSCYWLSGFFFTQCFLTGVLQNYARRASIPIDQITFDFEVSKSIMQFVSEELRENLRNGTDTRGLFFQGAGWNMAKMCLDESQPKSLFVECPNVRLIPTPRGQLRLRPHYECPVYKTSSRRGTLSTTGHSTNFVMMLRVPTELPARHWVKRGVALLTQLDD